MSINFSGMGGSGLPANMVEQLMQAERIPVRNMEINKSKKEARLDLIKDFGTKVRGIVTSLGDIGDRNGFKDLKLNSSNEKVLTGAPTPGETPTGEWNIEVAKLARKASAITNGFPDMDETKAGVGYIRFITKEGDEKEIYISEAGSTLDKIAKTINGSGMGVKASIVNDRDDLESPYRLIISGSEMGSENNLGFPNLYFLDGEQDLYFNENRESENGTIIVDGFPVGIADNKLENFIPGVTLDIGHSAPGSPVTISVTEDYKAIEAKLDGFVNSVNSILSFIQQQNSLTKDTDTSKTLGGDSLLSNVQRKLTQIIQGRVVGTGSKIKRMHELGVEFNRNGTLEFKKEKFNNLLKSSPKDVLDFVIGDGFRVGFFAKIKSDMKSFTDQGYGSISSKRKSFERQVRDIDKNIERREKRLVTKEQMLRDKFSKLEESLAKIKGQGSALGGANLG